LGNTSHRSVLGKRVLTYRFQFLAFLALPDIFHAAWKGCLASGKLSAKVAGFPISWRNRGPSCSLMR